MSKKPAPAWLGRESLAHRLLQGTVAVLTAAALATIAGRFGSFAWPFELMSHFAVQLLAVQAAGLAVLVLLRKRLLTVSFLPFAVVNLLLIAPYAVFPLWRAEAAAGPTRLKVMAANIKFALHDRVLLQTEIRRVDPDVIVLIEPSEDYLGDSSPLRGTHPHVIFHRDGAGTGIMIASRIAWERASTFTLSSSYSPSVYATFCPAPQRGPAGCVDVLGVHPVSPIGANRAHRRDRELSAIAEFVRERQPERFVVLGDFNTTPWSVRFSELLERSGLSESPLGRGLTATWTSRNPLFGLPIDHVLVGRDIQVLDQEVGRDIASDHYPVSATLGF
jgi:endonuclease/exonuclease/phosphatase (EEP) superfamily protein YafD